MRRNIVIPGKCALVLLPRYGFARLERRLFVGLLRRNELRVAVAAADPPAVGGGKPG